MKATRLVALVLGAVLMWASPGLAQVSRSPLLTTFPGWGVQAWWDVGWSRDWNELAAEAFHFSPDGSFYHVLDENVVLKAAVTFDAKRAIAKHRIPIDAIGVVIVKLDGVDVEPWVNDQHRVVELDLTQGRHTLELISNSYKENDNIGLVVVGRCLWGTEKDITFVRSGLPE